MMSVRVFFVFLVATVTADLCPQNYNYFPNGKCYRLFPTPIKIVAARYQCLNDEASLPSIHNDLDNQVLTNVTYSLGVQAWLGINCPSSLQCTWDDGSPYNYSNFVNGGPDTNLGNCAFLVLSSGDKGKWESADCNFELKATVCEKDQINNPTNCEMPFSTGTDGRCYYLPASTTDSHDNAEAYCKAYGADLVSIENKNQNSAVENFANSSGIFNIYIGLAYNGISYIWNDPQAVYNYTNWEGGFPNVNSGSCVLMSVGGPFDGMWRNIDCGYPLPFICGYGSGNPSPVTVSPSNACPNNNHYSASGYLTSPGYPNYYGGSIECSYFLQVASGNLVTVKFSDFDLKSGDYVDLFDGQTNLIVRLQGTISFNQWFTTYSSSQMKVVFVSNAGTATNRGWYLYFKGTTNSTNVSTTVLPPYSPYPPTVCPATNYYDHGTIVSPGFPSNYSDELNCTYILQVASNFIVRINFDIFTLAAFDSVTLYDGPDETSAIINILSGSYSPNTQIFQSTGSFMTIRFLTDSVSTAQGFIATFKAVSSGSSITSTKTSTTTTTAPGNVCADGWFHDPYEMYCYKYFPNGGPWQQNLQNCANIGTQLLTIHDGQQETDILNFVRSIQGGSIAHVWIGLKKSSGTWGWSDGTAVTYLGFLPGEPSNAGNCAAIQSFTDPSGWVALDCTTALPYICYHDALSK